MKNNTLQKEREVRGMTVLVVSVIVSVITAKIVATYYFKKIDGYVKEMCEMTEENNNLIKTTLHKFRESSCLEE